MKGFFVFIVFSASIGLLLASDDNTIYQFTAKDSDGNDVSFEKYRGKVVVIVNVASECGFTQKNYVQLKELLDKYKSRGLQIAAFPSNEFGGQVNKIFDIYALILRNLKATQKSRNSFTTRFSSSLICTQRLRLTEKMSILSTRS
jgi:hypothetical protein